MTASPSVETTPKNIKTPSVEKFILRRVLPTHDRGNKPILEIAIPGRGIMLIASDNTDALEKLFAVGIAVHEGGKFYLNDKPMDLDVYNDLDMEIEITNAFGGRKMTGAVPLFFDVSPAGGLSDTEFLAAWEIALNVAPPLKTVKDDPDMWCARISKIITEFYTANGYGRDKGRDTAEFISATVKTTRSSGDVPFVQTLLKRRLREEFPKGKPMPKEKTFDVEGHQVEIGLLIVDENSNRNLTGSGRDLEIKILGKKASEFIKDADSYSSAQELVKLYFGQIDEYLKQAKELTNGLDANDAELGLMLNATDKNAIRFELFAAHKATCTLDTVQQPDYDKSLILAEHASAIEAFKTKDQPRFENGIKDQPKPADPVDDKTTSPDEPAAPPPQEKPADPPAPKFTAEEWSKWLTDQKQDYPDLKPADIMAILDIKRASDFNGYLKDASERLKRAMEVRRADALVEEAKRILKDKGVPLEEWPKLIEEAGDPKIFTATSYERNKYQEKVLVLANAYMVATAGPKTESALTTTNQALAPADTEKAIVPAQASYGVLAALKLPTPSEMQVMAQLAEAIVGSNLFRGVDTKPRAIAIMLKALQWGIGAIEAFENIYIIPSKKGDQLYPSTNLLRARVMAHPACLRFDVTGDDKKATAIVWRKGDQDPVSFTYSIEDARTAGLLDTYDNSQDLKRATWGTNPKAMLQHRVGRLAVMAKFPDVAIGLLPAESEE